MQLSASLREGSDLLAVGTLMSTHNFNPRSREGSDSLSRLASKSLQFQSTLPRRERRKVGQGIHQQQRYFNPRSREGSDRKPPNLRPSDPRFQSTLLRRERRELVRPHPGQDRISIHAPAKGATSNDRTIAARYLISIHAPAKGATIEIMCSRSMMPIFQSTPPRRERLSRLVRRWVTPHFNPRSREGSDCAALVARLAARISIHAPAKGATRKGGTGLFVSSVSIHAPAKGATTAA